MKLKSLEINGFKSFADKTVIDFMPGMTGIVGPNGSGKSNIIEAIRWVMGEQSAKGLRGNTMADVIFGGSKKRPALGRASVSMTIDNSDHYLHSAFDEVQISRRLYRNGDAEYLINGVKSRLKDITDLFVDTGLGRESFSIINQGKVEAIFNAKAEDRRAIIEDVAGVFKYKQNKNKSQNQLLQTQENLDRLLDIIKEISDRLQPLEKQADEAEEFLSLRKQFDRLKLVKIARVKKDLSAKELTTQSEITALTKKIEQVEKKLGDKTSKEDLINSQSNELESKLNNLNHSVEELTQKYEHALGENNLQKQKRDSLEHNRDLLNSEQTKLKQQLQELADRTNRLKQQIEEEKKSQEKAEQQVKEITDKLAKSGQLSEQDKLANLRNNYVQSMQDAASLSNQLINLDKEKLRYDARKKSLSTLSQQLKEKLSEKRAALNKIKNSESASKDSKDLEEQSAHFSKQLNQKKAELSALEKQHSDLLARYNQIRIRSESLQNANANLDLFVGVRNLLANRQRFPGLFGTVAELIKVDDQYALAIETALGAGLQNIVVDSQSTAKKAIEFLTSRRLGRVTFLPIEVIKARYLPANIRSQLDQEKDFIGIGAALIGSEKKYSNIIENLLGTTLIAANLNAAFRISKLLNQRYRVVTIDGHIVNAGGSITGGANRHQSGLLSKRVELDQLNKQLDDLKKEGQKVNRLIDDSQKEIAVDENKFIELRNSIVAQKESLQLQVGGKKIAEDALNQAEKQFQSNQLEISQLEDEFSSIPKTREKLAAQVESLQEKNDQLSSEINTLEVSLLDARSSAKQQNSRLLTSRENLAAIKVQIQADSKQAGELSDQKNRLGNELSDNQKQIDLLNNQLEVLDNTLKNTGNAEQISDNLKLVNLNRDQFVEKKQKLNQEENSLKVEINQLQLELRQLLDRKNRFDTKLATVKSRLDENSQDLKDIGEPDISKLDLLEKEDFQSISSRLNALKSELAKHNAVNLAAIDELKRVKERYDFLTGQRDDLITASENLKVAMQEMDHEVVTRFKKTFDAVAEQFKRTFSELFAGGQASLELTDPKDLLTSGIEIRVQPPGKKLQRLSLLSGGEKALTAIALLLAILLVHPVPFAILDETEAALDESNVDNFGRFLRDFGENTQFIVITHRKGTMRYANVLYGVTMQEPGVSTMVSVDLEKAGTALEDVK
ncbi:chromosome segregation protein SMC [Oenococcus oeni]|uniref:Chromosome partition protein Smc n=1 Tax=Oenococcus oeni TaxID=1247 RepID=A0AAQ2USY8_OENOE|nr:chromosome segregation protein SMC [Oenococcus oeni]KGI03121.1 chromosome segregation protein SMC [Oenococcus oeni IOEB_C52]OIL39095.1 chromosome segregation protein SMC [Oenococcus oeni]OIM24967.1 chromosome segregation protein SMC [Oenococcus oeni]OIM27253.1 chromosome segregation protein SMC [Oenococcus oeni]OLQ40953.1 chromosome segregation protein SMC [Oenococcus oeni]